LARLVLQIVLSSSAHAKFFVGWGSMSHWQTGWGLWPHSPL